MDMSVETSENRTNELKPKMHFTGKVSRISLAGALLDIGQEKPGILHISQLVSPTDQPIKRVEDVLQIGQEVEVWVRKIKEGRIELTMVKPLDLDWRDIKKGMTVKGKVVRLEKFGAFVEIGAERPGLIHISELAHGYVRTPSDVVKEEDEVEAQVLDVNRRKKQIKLSLKALQEPPVKEEEPAHLIEAAQREKGGGGRRRRGHGEDQLAEQKMAEIAEPTEPAIPDPTAMEIAMREAMEKAKSRRQVEREKNRRNKSVSREQEDILARTLENKVRTS